MTKKCIIFLAAAAGSIVIISVYAMLRATFNAVNRPEPIVWDFSHGDSLDAVHWPKGHSGDEFERKGRFELTIIGSPELGGKVIFHENVDEFVCYRRVGKLDGASIFFGGTGVSAETAYGKIRDIMTAWRFPPEKFEELEKWHDGIAKRVSYPVFVAQHQSDRQFGQNAFICPSFDAIKWPNVRVRITVVGGKPEEGTCRCRIGLAF
jgi:hypothetical protein